MISAGWIPGVSELVPAYAHARALATMEALDSLTCTLAIPGSGLRTLFGIQPGFFAGKASTVRAISARANEPARRFPSLLSNLIWAAASAHAASPCFPSPNWMRSAVGSKTAIFSLLVPPEPESRRLRSSGCHVADARESCRSFASKRISESSYSHWRVRPSESKRANPRTKL